MVNIKILLKVRDDFVTAIPAEYFISFLEIVLSLGIVIDFGYSRQTILPRVKSGAFSMHLSFPVWPVWECDDNFILVYYFLWALERYFYCLFIILENRQSFINRTFWWVEIGLKLENNKKLERSDKKHSTYRNDNNTLKLVSYSISLINILGRSVFILPKSDNRILKPLVFNFLVQLK